MKYWVSVLMVLFISLGLVACGQEQVKPEKKNQLTYSNLVDKQTQDDVKTEFLAAGVSEEALDGFFKDLNEYNETIDHLDLVKSGFKTIDGLIPVYDQLSLMEHWEAKQAERLGHNCRLTTYRLLNEFIAIKDPKIEDDTMLFAEKEIVLTEPNLLDGGDENEFLSLFAHIPTQDTTDVATHVETLKKNWQNKGLRFTNDKISMVSVVFNSNFEEKKDTAQLFIGHVGLLWEKEGKLYFLEKLSFTEPYQLVQFDTRQDLSDYLMNRYDVDTVDNTAIPFVMENDQLIEGYRPNFDKGKSAQ
ncbi:DUF4300 family protein [Streptococcus fryi]